MDRLAGPGMQVDGPDDPFMADVAGDQHLVVPQPST
jgi:hypothetical protein